MILGPIEKSLVERIELVDRISMRVFALILSLGFAMKQRSRMAQSMRASYSTALSVTLLLVVKTESSITGNRPLDPESAPRDSIRRSKSFIASSAQSMSCSTIAIFHFGDARERNPSLIS